MELFLSLAVLTLSTVPCIETDRKIRTFHVRQDAIGAPQLPNIRAALGLQRLSHVKSARRAPVIKPQMSSTLII